MFRWPPPAGRDQGIDEPTGENDAGLRQVASRRVARKVLTEPGLLFCLFSLRPCFPLYARGVVRELRGRDITRIQVTNDKIKSKLLKEQKRRQRVERELAVRQEAIDASRPVLCSHCKKPWR